MVGYIEGPRRGRPVVGWKDILRVPRRRGRPVVGWKDILRILGGEENQL